MSFINMQYEKRRESKDAIILREMCDHRRNLHKKPRYEDVVATLKLTKE